MPVSIPYRYRFRNILYKWIWYKIKFMDRCNNAKHNTMVSLEIKGQFHQCSKHRFYVCRSPKHKISVKSSVSFFAFGIRAHKSCVKNVAEIDTWIDFTNFYAKLLHTKIPKAQKDWQLDSLFCAFWICAHKSWA